MKFSKLTERISQLGSDKWLVHLEARKLKKNNPNIIELTIGEPDQLPPNELIQKCYESMISGRTKYSNGRGEENLLEALSKKYQSRTSLKVSRNNFLCLPGTQTALFATVMCLVEEGDEILVGDPYYATYEGIIQSSGADLIPIPLREEHDFSLQENDIRKKITNKSKAILLNYPHNPTGGILRKKDLSKLVDIVEKNKLWIISDEVYEELIFSEDFISPLEIESLAKRTVVVSSISKSHAAPGFRSGWVFAQEDVINKMLPLAETMLFGNQPFIADMTAYAISNKSKTAIKMKTDYERRAKLICKKLSKTKNIRPIMPKSGMFILIKLELKNYSDEKFSWELLRTEGIAVMPGSSFGLNGKNLIRLSLTVADNTLEKACERIDEFVRNIV